MNLQLQNIFYTICEITSCIVGTLSANQKLNTSNHQVDLVVQSLANGVSELNVFCDNGMICCK